MIALEHCPWCGDAPCATPCAAGTAEAARQAGRGLVYGRVHQVVSPRSPEAAPRDAGRVVVLAGVLAATLAVAARHASPGAIWALGVGAVAFLLIGLCVRAGGAGLLGIVAGPAGRPRAWLRTRRGHLLEVGLELPSGAALVVRLWSRDRDRDEAWLQAGRLVAVAGRRVPDQPVAALHASTIHVRAWHQERLAGSIHGRRPWPPAFVAVVLAVLAAGCWALGA